MTNEELYKFMQKDKAVRRAIVKRSHKLFFYYYFSHYVEYPIAPSHEELFKLTEEDNHSMFVISAFRGFGKSAILSLSYPIWSIINNRAKYILIISENQQKAQTLLNHIKVELESNELLKRDLGPFQEERLSWNSVSLHLKNYNAKITAVSTEQSVRSLRHQNHRPDLIIIDDSESQNSVRTLESRDKLNHWLSSDVIPAGHLHTKIIIIGSILHPDSLIPRLQKRIDEKRINGIYKMYPIIDSNGDPTWLGKYPDLAKIEEEKSRGIPDREWAIEYMLQTVLDDNQIIKEEWIQYYDYLPDENTSDFRYYSSGVDLAISEAETADYTAMVSGAVYKRVNEKSKLYILPFPINERLNGPAIQDKVVNQSLMLGNGQPTIVYIEDVAFQRSIIDFIKQKGIPAIGVPVAGSDKRARLTSISEFIKSGRVLFPKKGAEKLIQQLVFFGMEKHDDLSDALVILVLKFFEKEDKSSGLIIPSSFNLPENIKSENELINEADKSLIQKQERMRGKPDMAKILENKYELENFRKLMRYK